MAKKADPSAIQKALALISDGNSVRWSCIEAGIDKATFLRNVDANQYARARDACADAQFEDMADLEQDCLNEKLKPDVFRVVMDSRKWRLARMRPRVYGDKQSVDVNANVDFLTEEQRDAAIRGALLEMGVGIGAKNE